MVFKFSKTNFIFSKILFKILKTLIFFSKVANYIYYIDST